MVESYSVDSPDDMTGKNRIVLNWLLPEKSDPALNMALSVLSYALMGTQAAPLRKSLVDAELAEDVIGGGVSASLRQMTFSVGLKNVAEENLTRAEALILDSLADLAETGIDEDMIEAALNSIEFSLRENNTGAYPRGLVLYMRALNTWLYDGDPLDAIRFEAPLRAVKQALTDDPGYLADLIRTYLLENEPVTVILKPDPELRDQLDTTERERLAAAKAAMSPAEIEAVIEQYADPQTTSGNA